MKKTIKKTYKEIAIEFKNTRSEKSFSEFFYKIKPGLYNYVLNIVKDADVAADITSITLTTVYQKIDQYDESYQISTWTYRIAYNQCIGWLRYNKRKVSLDNVKNSETDNVTHPMLPTKSYEYDDDYMTVEDEHRHQEELLKKKINKVHDAINALPPIYVNYMKERFINNRSYKNIYEIMKKKEPGINEQTVKNRIFKGRSMIKKQLKSLELFQ